MTNPFAEINLHLDFLNMHCSSPVTVASGTFGSGKEYDEFVNLEALAAVTSKGVASKEWLGNPGIRIDETAGGMLNSIGLQNRGAEHFLAKDVSYLKENAPNANLIVNVVGKTAQEYVQAIEMMEHEDFIDAFELNISCPNVDSGGLAFGATCESASEVVSLARKATKKPLIVKLSPNVTDIALIAAEVEAAGADAVSLINTLLGMSIDAKARKPVFDRVVAGLSGPAIKPVALRCVYQVYKAVNIPIIGMGGAVSGEDVAEFMLAGATLVALGTANFKQPSATMRAIEELRMYCAEQGVKEVSDLIGALHD